MKPLNILKEAPPVSIYFLNISLTKRCGSLCPPAVGTRLERLYLHVFFSAACFLSIRLALKRPVILSNVFHWFSLRGARTPTL